MIKDGQDYYLVDGKKWKVVFTNLFQPNHYGVYFWTPSIEIYRNAKYVLEKRSSGIAFYFLFWLLEIRYIK